MENQNNIFPKVSIITVVLNSNKALEFTINNISNQSYSNIEYIVIDGKSNDGTVDVIKKYESHITNWISEEDTGIYNAMNKGIGKSTGEWLIFFNAGDGFYHKNVLSNIFKIPIENDHKVIIGNTCLYSLSRSKLQRNTDIHTQLKKFGLVRINHQSTLIRKNAFKELGYYNESFVYAADNHWINMALKKFGPQSFYLTEEIIAIYDLTGISSSLNHQRKMHKEFIQISKVFVSSPLKKLRYFFSLKVNRSKSVLLYRVLNDTKLYRHYVSIKRKKDNRLA